MVNDQLLLLPLNPLSRKVRMVLLNINHIVTFLCLKPSYYPLNKTKQQVTWPNPYLPLTSFQVLPCTHSATVYQTSVQSLNTTNFFFCTQTFPEHLWISPRLALCFHSDLCSNVTSSERSSLVPVLNEGFLLLSIITHFISFINI